MEFCIQPRIQHFCSLGFTTPPYFQAPKGYEAIITERGRLGDQSYVKGYWYPAVKPNEEKYLSPFDGRTK